MSRSPPMVNDPPDSAQVAGAASSRRVHARLEVRLSVTLIMADGSMRSAMTQDLSRLGMSLITDKPIAPGSKCALRLDGAAGLPAVQDLAAKAVYSSYTSPKNFRIGLVFVEADDAVAALQALMGMNAAAGSRCPEASEGELLNKTSKIG